MARKMVVTCDGCGDEIDTTTPWMHVNCNLHRDVKVRQIVGREIVVGGENDEPVIQPEATEWIDGMETGGVVELAFCKPACATKWFKGEEKRGFEIITPEVPQADPKKIPMELRGEQDAGP